MKNSTQVTLNLSSSVVGGSIDENNFLYKLILTNTHTSRIAKASANGSWANIKLFKDSTV